MFTNKRKEIISMARDYLKDSATDEVIRELLSLDKSVSDTRFIIQTGPVRRSMVANCFNVNSPLIDSPRDFQRSTTKRFIDTDEESLFHENLNRFGNSWIWANKDFDYRINSLGYRMKEFDELNWDNYMAVFGCSYTAAIGVPEEESWPTLIANHLGMDLLNAGIPGASNDLIVANVIKLLGSNKPKPKLIIVSWSSILRKTYFFNGKYIIHGSIHQDDRKFQHVYEDHLKDQINYDFAFAEQKNIVDTMCRLAGIKVWHKSLFNFSEFTPDVDIIPCPIAWNDINEINELCGRDLHYNQWVHPGTRTQQNVFEYFKQKSVI